MSANKFVSGICGLFLYAVAFLYTVDAYTCADGWTNHNNLCYNKYSRAKSWSAADEFCRTKNGRLVTIPDSETLEFIRKEFVNQNRYTSWWIGLHGDKTGLYVWGGSLIPYSYTNWENAQPANTGKEQCVYISGNGKWSAKDCTGKEYFLCEKRADVTCGGEIFSGHGLILSPNYPQRYPTNSSCRWDIYAENLHVIRITFHTPFDVTQSTNCVEDYVKVFDYSANGTMTLIGTWCGGQKPPVLISSASKMRVEFHSSGVDAGVGFSASWQSTTKCGGIFHPSPEIDMGLILSPNYPSRYDNNESCRWTIRVEEGYVVKLVFGKTFDLKSNDYCGNDRVVVYEVSSDGSQNLFKSFCGHKAPKPFVSVTSSVVVEFISDDANVGQGFSLTWLKVVDNCGGNFVGQDQGLILSPNYPFHYNDKQMCRWSISVEDGYRIQLTFHAPFNVEYDSNCNYDVLMIYDVQSDGTQKETGALCGEKVPSSMISSTSKMELEFTSDDSNNRKGFSISWAKVDNTTCGGTYTIGHKEGLMFSPNYPSFYFNNLFCNWTINVEEGYLIQLTFEAPFELPTSSDCKNDSVKVFDVLSNGEWKERESLCGTSLPPDVTSSGSKMVVEFKSDQSNVGKGFSAIWRRIEKPCHTVLEGMGGYFTSPDFPSFYPESLNCRWEILVPEGQFISLDFVHFDLGFDDNKSCSSDNLEIYDVFGSGTWVRRGQWCTSDLKPNIKSFGQKLVVEFHTDDQKANSGRGFNATWKAVNECGGNLNASQGYIMSYNYQYGNHSSYSKMDNLTCRWNITIPEPFHIYFQFNPPLKAQQCKDFEFLDAPDNGKVMRHPDGWCDPQLGKQHVTSFGNTMEVVYKPDQNDSDGFYAYWKSVCGVNYETSPGSLNSPNYPSGYEHDIDCRWEIIAEKNHQIRLEFDPDFEIEPSETGCEYDYVEIFYHTGKQLYSKGKFCGSTAPTVLVSYYPRVVVVFHSDRNKNGKGFSLSWNSDKSCGEVYQSNHGILSFPNVNAPYPQNMICQWEIHVDKWFHKINLRFNQSLHIGQDELRVLWLSDLGQRVDLLLNASSPDTLLVDASTLVVGFKSNSNKPGKGFHIMWDAVCQQELDGENGTFMSPNYPNEYPPDLDCQWTIKGAASQLVYLKFNSPFQVEGNYMCDDYVEVLDFKSNGSLVSKGKLCGAVTPSPVVSTSTSMVVRFHSDRYKSARGFSATWHTACGEKYNSDQGSISLPTLDEHYVMLECRWEIQVRKGHVIRLSFKDPFEIEETPNCKFDYVELFDVSVNDSLISKGRFCGSVPPPTQWSTNSKMVLTFHSDDRKSGRGFQAEWDSICGEVFDSAKGNISTLEYGVAYPPNMNCHWKIKAPWTLKLFFQPLFDLETSNGNTCNYDYVEVLDSFPNGTVVSKGRFCGDQAPPAIISSSNVVLVRFHSDGEKSGKGFTLNWLPACGGTYYSKSGQISSPRNPFRYPNNVDCRWEIEVDKSYMVKLSFELPFRVEDNNDTETDYLEVFYVSANGSLVSKGRFTGAVLPDAIISATYKMVVVFHSDERLNAVGFRAVWDSVCGDVFHKANGSFTSPGYPDSYSANLDCRWEVKAPKGKRIELQFDKDFDIELNDGCGYDNVKVLDYFPNGTETTMGPWCGKKQQSFEVISTSSNLTILFHSDLDKNGKGFKATWKTIDCNHTFHDPNGYLMSPNYPVKYPFNEYCRWELKKSYITLEFKSDFQLESSNDCAWDYVEVFLDEKSSGRYCGGNKPKTVTSMNETIVVVFKSDNSNSFGGFFASWTSRDESKN